MTGEGALTQGVATSMGRGEGTILKTNSEAKWIGGTNALTREKETGRTQNLSQGGWGNV